MNELHFLIAEINDRLKRAYYDKRVELINERNEKLDSDYFKRVESLHTDFSAFKKALNEMQARVDNM